MKMKKMLYCFFAIMISMVVTLNPLTTYAADILGVDTVAEDEKQITDTSGSTFPNEHLPPVQQEEDAKSVLSEKMTINLTKSLYEYLMEQSEQNAYENIKNLIIITQEEYQLSLGDLAAINEKFGALERLDVRGSVFQSETILMSWKACFEAKNNFIYKFSDGSFVEEKNIEETTKNKTETGHTDSIQENTSHSNDIINEEKKSYDTKLNGIYFLEKGPKLDMGISYESTDPNIVFEWLYYDLSKKQWSSISGASESNWTTWFPRMQGDYWVSVQAKTADGKITSYTCAYVWKGIVTNLSGIYVMNQGAKYDMGICYTSNDPDIQFEWKIYDLKRQSWALHQSKSKGNWMTWNPKKEGIYWIHVEAIDSLGGVTSYTMPIYFGGLKVELGGIGVIEREGYIDVGVSYTSNDIGLQFRWLLYDVTDKNWTEQICDWTTGNWASWKPKKSGEYWFWVEAKTAAGEVKVMSYVYRVSKARIKSFKANPDTPYWVGKDIRLKGKYWDYKDEVYSERIILWDGKTWRELPSIAGEAIWTPQELGNYLLCYEIYGENDLLIDQSFKGYNIENPYVNLNGIYVRYDGNKKFSMAVNHSTNDKEIQFQWLYYDVQRGTWHPLCDWNTSNATSWQTEREGMFWIHVKARTSDGVVKQQTIAYQVSYVTLLTQFSTVSTNDFNGTYNMMKALRCFNNQVIWPGQTMSFSQISGGPWGPDQGYLQAGVVGGVGYGGGVCQASTTLYGAVIRAGLTIVERQNHSVPSTYVPIGLDAMVSAGISDFRFKNDFSYPITIKTITSGNTLIVQMYGLPAGWFDTIQPYSWHTGSRSAAAVRVYYKNGQEVHRQDLPSSYY